MQKYMQARAAEAVSFKRPYLTHGDWNYAAARVAFA